MSVLGERETRAASPPPRPSPRVWAWWGGDIGVMAIRSSGGGGGSPRGGVMQIWPAGKWHLRGRRAWTSHFFL